MAAFPFVVREVLRRIYLQAFALRAGLLILCISGGGALIRIGMDVAAAHALGSTSAYGVFAAVLATTSFASPLVAAGLNVLAARLIPQFVHSQDYPRLRGFVCVGLVVTAAAALAAVTVTLAATRTGLHHHWNWALFAVPVACLYGAAAIANGIARGFLRLNQAMLNERVAFEGALLIFIFVTWRVLELNLLMVGTLWAAAFAAATGWTIALSGISAGKGLFRQPIVIEPTWFTKCLGLAVAAGSRMLILRFDIIAFTIVGKAAFAANYAVAARLGDLVSFAALALAPNIAPHIAHLILHGRRQEAQAVVRSNWILGFCAGLFVILGIVIAGPMILRVYGAGFKEAYGISVIVALGQFVALSASPAPEVLVADGHTEKVVLSIMAGLLTKAITVYPLYLMMGPEGPAVSTAISLAVMAILQIRYVARFTGLKVGIQTVFSK